MVTVQRQERRGNFFKEMVYKKAVVCIGASRSVGEYFKEIGCQNIEIVPNGLNLKRFEGLEPKTHTGFVVITVARLEKVKGIEYLIEAASLINSKSQIPNPNFLIIGDGSQRKNLENLVKKLNLQEKVKFLGQIPNKEIPQYLAQADCFVLPSLKEGFGIAILEAQAAGVPVIGTRVGGIVDIIEDGKTGLLAEPKNPQALAEAIDKIYSGQKFAPVNLAKYDWQNIAEKVYEIYNSCRHLSS
jgi:glycosyltransferase involved in cell wall biosynthesis